ncbi:hypothetical protein LCL97_18765 [Seohaeicola saemankumensis]|nr:calcium-binding protein [Seohaeicola saemankumensis]MCA0872878.1 hypothetical protein [Seohaeicola saemankumensis]
MATITGTITRDVLTGTAGNDTLLPYGVGPNDPPDLVSGGNGRDRYDLREPIGQDPVHRYVIDDNGSDGATDRILNAGALIHTASLGYKGFTQALHDGDDLIIVTPSKPHRFRDPARPSYEITITDHFDGEAVEWLQAGGTHYRLPDGTIGTGHADLMAGTHGDDILSSRGGDDYVTGNRGHDDIDSGSGNDTVLGGAGRDTIRAGSGNDWVYGGAARDTIHGNGGQDFIYAETGNDHAHGGAGNDFIYGQDGNDHLYGGSGQDLLSGGDGNDRLFGGAGGDTYRYGYDVDALGTNAPAGHDVIFDRGETPSYLDYDRIELFGYYGPSDGTSWGAYARLSFARVGDDMVITSDNGAGSITVRDQFGPLNHFIEELHFNAGYWTPLRFRIVDGARTDIGDDRRYSGYEGGEWNEILFGTDGDDAVFGNSGTNFIWLGGGADTLIYKEADPEIWQGSGGGACNDIVMDFDIAEDVMDFSEIDGLTLADLIISDNAAGNATVYWDSGDFEISDISIELRGVTAATLTEDHFVFG